MDMGVGETKPVAKVMRAKQPGGAGTKPNEATKSMLESDKLSDAEECVRCCDVYVLLHEKHVFFHEKWVFFMKTLLCS